MAIVTDSDIIVGLGGNMEGTRLAFSRALDLLAVHLRLKAISPVYLTAPQDYLDQEPFLNLVAVFLPNSSKKSHAVLNLLLDVESVIGRDRCGAIPKGPRLIDLDLLLYGKEIVRNENLTVPHPRMHLRRFVLEPLCEITPLLYDPRSGILWTKMLGELSDQAIYSKSSLGYTISPV